LPEFDFDDEELAFDEGYNCDFPGDPCATCWCKGAFCDCGGCFIQNGRNVCSNCEDND